MADPSASATDEAMHPAQLFDYLQARLPNPPKLADFTIEKIAFGYSNITYRVGWGEQELVLRRPPVGANIKSGHDMEREFKVLSGLLPLYQRIPRPLLFCADTTIIGAPFYVMQMVDGVILRFKLPPDLDVSPPVMTSISTAFIDNLAAIHSLDYTQTDLKLLARTGSSYVERQVKGWLDRYQKCGIEVAAIEKSGKWLLDNLRPDVAWTMIHNDYKYDNLILDADNLSNIKAVLDWEMATIGDPLMDLGTSLAYWVDANDPPEILAMGYGPTMLPGNLNREQLAQRYALQSGRTVDDILYYFVFGLFKNSVVGLQIFARYKAGLIKEERFARIGKVADVNAHTAVVAIEKNRLINLY